MDPSAATNPAETEQYLFFNVMPRAKNSSAVVSPTIKISSAAPKTSATNTYWLKYRWYAIGLVVVVIAGLIGYYFYNKYTESLGQKAETALVVSHPHPIPAAAATPTAVASSTIAGFTTPQSWRNNFFNACTDITVCGDEADPDHDGLSNLQEYKLGTDPNHNDSDGDGISDGDKVLVFGMDPLAAHNGTDPSYTDADYLKGGYDFKTGQLLPAAELSALTQRMNQYCLHEPTVTTLAGVLTSLYHFNCQPGQAPAAQASSTPVTTATSTPTSTPVSLPSTTPTSVATSTSMLDIDQSPSAKENRDAQRTTTLQNIAVGLVKYFQQNKSYPDTTNFADMASTIKPYNLVATNPVDPINQGQFVYSYTPSPNNSDFVLSYFSETENQLIQIHAADAQKTAAQQQADNYDEQRKTDLANIQTALLLYSNDNISTGQDYVFPTEDKYQSSLVPKYLAQMPKDPETGQDYDYQVSQTFDAFTVKAALDDAPAGYSGYLCNEEECRYY